MDSATATTRHSSESWNPCQNSLPLIPTRNPIVLLKPWMPGYLGMKKGVRHSIEGWMPP